MRASIIISLFVALGLCGCLSVNATGPEHVNINGKEFYLADEPPANILAGDPRSPEDLRRENEQLKDRIEWVDGHIKKLHNKDGEVQRKINDAMAKLRELRAQVARYQGGAK
jgi:hypothetical protein